MRPRAWCSLIRHLVSSWDWAQASFPSWCGWLSEKCLKCRLTPPFQRTWVQAGFIPPKPIDIQMLDGGGSDSHVIKFAETYRTQTMDGVIQGVTKEPADLGHHHTQTHRDTQPKRR